MPKLVPRSRWRVAMLVVVVIAAGAAQGGCYYLQAAVGQLEITTRARGIDALIRDPQTDETLRRRLAYVRDAREFAVAALGLPDNSSYRRYVEIDRPFVVWNVFATERYSIEPRTWCFPVAGCVVYRGYFDRESAERYARRMRLAGDDAMVAGAVAYSTLGHFADPVLSSMMRWDDVQLAATLFHELAHQVVYVPGDARFNEAFATVVEDVGIERWLQSRERGAEFARFREGKARAADFTRLLLHTRAQLARLYASEAAAGELEEGKQRAFGDLKYQYRRLRDRWNGYDGYDWWFDRALNNAHLVPVATYHECVAGFEQLLAAAGGDLPYFYAEVTRVARLDEGARAATVCAPADERLNGTAADTSVRPP